MPGVTDSHCHLDCQCDRTSESDGHQAKAHKHTRTSGLPGGPGVTPPTLAVNRKVGAPLSSSMCPGPRGHELPQTRTSLGDFMAVTD